VSEFALQSSIPIPPKPKRGNPNWASYRKAAIYPWAEMKVGTSFFVPLARGKSFSAASAKQKYEAKHGNIVVYEIRRVVEDGTDGVRVWRTK
jgi:hypothetical protein